MAFGFSWFGRGLTVAGTRVAALLAVVGLLLGGFFHDLEVLKQAGSGQPCAASCWSQAEMRCLVDPTDLAAFELGRSGADLGTVPADMAVCVSGSSSEVAQPSS